jgi:hypothetical protein
MSWPDNCRRNRLAVAARHERLRFHREHDKQEGFQERYSFRSQQAWCEKVNHSYKRYLKAQ